MQILSLLSVENSLHMLTITNMAEARGFEDLLGKFIVALLNLYQRALCKKNHKRV
jgi:hypothetical protein